MNLEKVLSSKGFRTYFVKKYLNDLDIFLLANTCKYFYNLLYIKPNDRKHILRRKRKTYMLNCAAKYGNLNVFEWFVKKFAPSLNLIPNSSKLAYLIAVNSKNNRNLLEIILKNERLYSTHYSYYYRRNEMKRDTWPNPDIINSLWQGFIKCNNVEAVEELENILFLCHPENIYYIKNKFSSCISKGSFDIAKVIFEKYYFEIACRNIIDAIIVNSFDMYKWILSLVNPKFSVLYRDLVLEFETAMRVGNMEVLKHLTEEENYKYTGTYFIKEFAKMCYSLEVAKYVYETHKIELKEDEYYPKISLPPHKILIAEYFTF